MQYINIWKYESPAFPFQIFVGGRGTGKTYSALKGAIERGDPFVYMRRTGNELDLTLDGRQGEGANPFKPLNRDLGIDVRLKAINKNIAGIYKKEGEEEKKIGYGVALSTVAGARGLDFSDCTCCIYDEFIPEKHIRKIRSEGSAVLNAYETMNRNRELDGRDPMKMYLLANSNDIYNEVFKELRIVTDVEKMIRRGAKECFYPKRGLAVYLLDPGESFIKAKADTALYRLTAGSDFSEMALSNKFAYEDFSLIGSEDLKAYRPLCAVGDAYLYRKKGEFWLYASSARASVKEKFNPDLEQDAMRFCRRFGNLVKNAFVMNKIIFETYEIKRQILDMII